MTKILILGATGMLGHKLFLSLSKNSEFEVFATVRKDPKQNSWVPDNLRKGIIGGVDAFFFDTVEKVIRELKPDVVINCIGIIKQLPEAENAITSITINSLFPHLVARACGNTGARMIHVSSDCVFDGKKGNYTESDFSDATDLYGRTKYLGEVHYTHAVTLRTSIIGHELNSHLSLIDWFLYQKEGVRGFKKAIYTGFPTIEFCEIIEKWVIPNKQINGLYQVSAHPISKYDLLRLVANVYHKKIDIQPDEQVAIDRSLDSSRFRTLAGYNPPQWEELVAKMYSDYTISTYYSKGTANN